MVPKSLREAVLGPCHGGSGSGHFGTSKTLCWLRRGFYWGQHRWVVEDFCRRCDDTTHKGPLEQSHAPLQQQASGAPMERVGVDIVLGLFPESDRGNKCVLCTLDYFRKWLEAYALPDQEAETVADVLI